MGLSEFPAILSPVILYFGSNNGDGSLRAEITLICQLPQFPLLHLMIIAYICVPVKALSW
jgi:hypothetical protein